MNKEVDIHDDSDSYLGEPEQAAENSFEPDSQKLHNINSIVYNPFLPKCWKKSSKLS